MKKDEHGTAELPVRRSLKSVYALSAVIAILMSAASASGFLFQNTVYPSEELIRTFLPNDIINLLIGLPALLVSMWFTRYGGTRSRIPGLLFWPGAVFYVLYNYCVYLFALPFGMVFPLHLLLVTLSVYTFIALASAIDGKKIRKNLIGAVRERLAGGVLAGLGLLFFLRAAFMIISSLAGGTSFSRTELALHIADFLITPAWIAAGILLYKRKTFGYAAAPGLLFQACMLFIALFLFLLLQPLLTSTAFAPVDAAVIFIMGMICFIPFALFVRGALSAGDSASA